VVEEFDLTYLSIDSLTEGIGRSQIVPLLMQLSSKGLSINLISLEKEPPAKWLQQYISDSGISWRILEFGNRGLFGGIKRLLLIKRAISKTRLIHARSDIPALAGLLSARAPVIWDARALWSDQRLFLSENAFLRIIYRAFRLVERVLYKKSAAISTLSQAGLSALELRYKSAPKSSIVVPTSVDLTKFRFSKDMPPDIKVLYSGTYNSYYDLETSKSFINELHEICKLEVHWARPPESLTSNLGVGESKILSITYSEMPELISNYSFGDSICRQDAGVSLSAVMPTKVAEFLAVGRPVVINKGLGDYDNLIKQYRAGIVIDLQSDSLSEKAQEMLDLISDPDTPRRCRELAETHFSSNQAVESYFALYLKLCPDLTHLAQN
jgi:glycosyltransferase involved in cell wall biosynthesis